ncbi:23S rRNA (uracil(1939)-C(5))-methyltransferase RlmD [Bavariicoccus seileri]|uniref:23S rRNA (uracil(1939)-C(5))-methyltransferase RlmD n=1 Tax=Bavariicoccus seileri TaxID=549685 RepID=UPI0003B6C7C6|nr:23S rRNA (uracil(1939)-C(5))-methyltransferase RlmD [Bavariicoccus seileri]
MKKNERYETTIVDLTHDGMGVAKIDGFPLFVHDALPQETVELQVTKLGKKYGYGRVIKRLTDSPDRIEARDKLGWQTGTMPLQQLAYPAQLAFKTNQVQEALKRIGHIEVDVPETIGTKNPWGYRNKGQIPVQNVCGQLTTGFYKKGTHTLVPVENFHIQDPEIDKTVVVVRDLLRRLQLTAYNERNRSGDIRHIIVRRGQRTQQIMVIIVTAKKRVRPLQLIADELAKRVTEVVSVIQNVNQDKTNRILGQVNHVLYGKDYFEEELLGLTFKISPTSFFQVNTDQAEVLYQTALDFADLKESDTVIDAYCGIGSISLPLAKQAKHVYGVEVVPEAIEMARDNAELNGLDNTTFVAGTAEEVLPKWVEEGLHPDVIVVDPPRKGLDDVVRKTMIEVKAPKIVYVSCNPATLARDLADFVAAGYNVEKVQPVDMFPQTSHVETVVLMSRVDK